MQRGARRWAGAIEAIERGVCVYVKTGNADRPGNEALLNRGAHPAPVNLIEMLRAQPPKPGESQQQIPFSAMTSQDDFFSTAAAPAILGLLDRPNTAADIAQALGIIKKQADLWLARLVENGSVVKQRAKFRRAPADPKQKSLFKNEES